MKELREKIADTIQHLCESEYEINSMVESILHIPEMKEMIASHKHLKYLQAEFPEWAFSSNMAEPFRTWKEKAEKYDDYKDIIEYWNGKEKPQCEAATIDDCPWCKELGQGKIKEWKEKAERWDTFGEERKIYQKLLKDLEFAVIDPKGARAQLDLILSDLVVEERCDECRGYVSDGYSELSIKTDEPECSCHGTGTITRQPQVEEVVEGIVEMLDRRGVLGYTLKSGGILRMKREGE